MSKTSDKYRNWFDSEQLVSDLMDQAADDIDERDAEIERLREALKRIADYEGGPVDLIWEGMAEIARSALQQKESE